MIEVNGFKFTPQLKGKQILWDTKVTGLGLRVFPTGRKSFVLLYRPRGSTKQRLLTLGTVPAINVVQARELALKQLAGIADGADPVKALKRSRQEDGFSLSKLSELYLERHAKMKKRSWTEDDRRLRKYILPKLGHMSVESITRGPIAVFHHEVGSHSIYEANRSLALLSIMFTCARKWELVRSDWQNPCQGIEKFKEISRDRYLKEDEAPRLMESLRSETNPYIQALILLFLLTGCRKTELLTAKWDFIDWHSKALRLPVTKSGEIRYVPLSAPAIQVLRQIPREAGNPFIFCGRKKGSHLNNITKAWARIRVRAGLSDVRIHDLRRTVGTWMAKQGTHTVTIQHNLGHKDHDTTLIYARPVHSAATEAMELHGQTLNALIQINEIANG